MDILKSIFFGIVEGITEWLPVSSTGHLIIFEEFLEFSFDNVNGDFWNLYSIVIQLGAIMAVVTMFWSNLFPCVPAKRGSLTVSLLECGFAPFCGVLLRNP